MTINECLYLLSVGHENKIQCRKSVSHPVSRIAGVSPFSRKHQLVGVRSDVHGRSQQMGFHAETVLHVHRAHVWSSRRVLVEKLLHFIVVNGQNCETVAHIKKGVFVLFSAHRFCNGDCFSSKRWQVFSQWVVGWKIAVVEYTR